MDVYAKRTACKCAGDLADGSFPFREVGGKRFRGDAECQITLQTYSFPGSLVAKRGRPWSGMRCARPVQGIVTSVAR